MAQSAPTARSVAASILVRVARDEAFAAAALDAEIERSPQLDPRDKGLATELVYGTLRVLPWLKDQVGKYAPRGTDNLDDRVVFELALAVYQLYFLDRVPAFAAVSSAVDAVRKLKGPKVAGFVNAVLRKIAADAAKIPGDKHRALLEHATLASVDPGLRASLERALGQEGARSFVSAGVGPPPVGLRVEDAASRQVWLEKLAASSSSKGASFELGKWSPHAILARGAGKLHTLCGWAEGHWTVQEEGSQLVALGLGAARGEIVLDACAGRGHKSGLIARYASRVDVADLHPSKLEALARELDRVGVLAGASFAVDWTVGSGECTGLYDAVLVDAPCSGIGTLRRRPELAVRATRRKLETLASLQLEIASRVAERVRPGGRLVYAVCSVVRDEAEDVIGKLIATHPDLEPAPFAGEPVRALAGESSTLRLLPHVHGTDGYFEASLRKKC